MTEFENIEAAGGTTHWARTPDGTSLRYGVLPTDGTPRGAVLLLPGYSEFIEKYLETGSELQRAGYSVLLLDWRGQGLSDRKLSDHHKGHVQSMDEHIGDVTQVLAESGFVNWSEDRAILGLSMGGHLGLRLAHGTPDLCRKLILIAPMIDMRTGPIPRQLAPVLTSAMIKLGRSTDYVFTTGPYDPEKRVFEGNPLTSDENRFGFTRRMYELNPELIVSGPTFAWLQAAFSSVQLIKSKRFRRGITQSVLIAMAGADTVVSNLAIKKLALELPRAQLVESPCARHEILQEIDSIREPILHEIERFLQK
jgi:lysophospholipase